MGPVRPEKFLTMLLRVILMLTIMCAIGVWEVNAQWRELQVTHFGPKEGISVRVNEVVQDMEGLLYLASTRGLIRYDGSNVTSFTHDPMDSTSIGPGEIYGIMSGSDSLIWLGLRYGGLNSFDPKTEKFRRFPVPDLPYFTIPTVDALFEDDAGNLWVGGHHFQLLQFDRETLQFTSYSPEWIDPEKYGRRLSIADIMQDNHNPDLLWLTVVDYRHPSDTIRGNYGLVTFDKRTKRFVSIENTGRVRHQDPDGIIWCDFLTNRVSKYDPATNVIEDVDIELTPKNLVRHLIPSGDGFWLAVAHKILSLDRTGEYTTLYEDASGAVEFHRMSRDRAGNLWIGSSPGSPLSILVNSTFVFLRWIYLTHHSVSIPDGWHIIPSKM
jgi:ligand-binding sensor domain-containing protein